MTVHGIIDCYLNPSSSIETYNEAYVSTVRFLTSSFAQSIGIQLVSSYGGSGATGDDYWNGNRRYQTGAFSVWKFNNATLPFYMLMTYNVSNNAQIGNSTPCAYENAVGYSGVAFAFAQRADGGNPWNGTVLKQGADTKGNPVWTPGASTLYAWPRSNNTGGTYAVSRQGCSSIPQARSVAPNPNPGRWHFVCDENNILIAHDDNFTNSYMFLYFGKYTPASGSNPLSPYVMLRSPFGNSPPFSFSTYGPAVAPSPGLHDGGVAHAHAPASGTRSVTVDYPEQALNYIQFNPTLANDTPYFYETPLFIACNEAGHGGYMGYVDWVRHVFGVIGSSTNRDKTRAYFGPAAYQTVKLSVPWDGVTMPTSNFHRSGVMF